MGMREEHELELIESGIEAATATAERRAAAQARLDTMDAREAALMSTLDYSRLVSAAGGNPLGSGGAVTGTFHSETHGHRGTSSGSVTVSAPAANVARIR